jgi:DNA repair exonuclease SbcCD ATPase subunit
VSKELNRIVNLDAMDRIMAKVVRWEREAKSVLAVGRDRLRAARAAKQELGWVTEANSQLEGLEAAEREYAQERYTLALLRATITRASEANETRKSLSAQGRGAKRGVWKLAGLKDSWDQSSQQARELQELMESLRNQWRVVCQLRKELERAQEKLVEIRGTRCPLCGQ